MSYAEIQFSGDDKTAFIKSSLQVWTKLNGTWTYVGKTNPEKQFSPGVGVAEWWDNTSGVQTLYVLDPDKVDTKLTFSFAQVLDENVLGIALHGEIDRATDPNNTLVYLGSNPGAFREGEWKFIGIGRTGRIIQLNVLRGVCVPSGSLALGTPGQYANCPIELRLLQDTTQVNTKRDLAYWTVQKPAAS